MELPHLSTHSSAPGQCCTHGEQAALSWCCNHPLLPWSQLQCPKCSFLPGVHHSVSVSLPLAASLSHRLRVAQKELVSSLKPGGTGWSLGQREERVPGQEEALQCTQHLGEGCRMCSKGVGGCGIALAEPHVLHSCL